MGVQLDLVGGGDCGGGGGDGRGGEGLVGLGPCTGWGMVL